MKKFSKCFTIIFFLFLSLTKENPYLKLSGKYISSEPLLSASVKYAFDGDLSTYFKSEEAEGGWIGLKLDSKYYITKLGFAFPKDSKNEDYLLGIIEAANDPTFYDSTILYMITNELKLGEMNYIEIKSMERFKYIRYLGPDKKYSIISELEIYGDDELDDNTALKSKKLSSEVYYYQPTNLPLMIINTENSVTPYDKENYISCTVTIIKDNKIVLKEKAVIKLRGNSTSRLEKLSYRIKFDKKQKVLDMPTKARSWALIANHSDKTLMRYLLAHKISSLFEMKFTPTCESIDMIINGDFVGNFGLCDQVEEGKGRIEVTEMDENCIKEPEITGGYAIAADGWAKQGGDSYYLSDKGVVLVIKYPKDNHLVKEQEKYILDHFNKVEEQVYNNITDNIDIETFCKYVLIEDLVGNGEAFWSAYMYKEREDDKFYFGPVWDFDLAFDNNQRIYPSLEIKDFVFKHDISAGTMNNLALKILSDEKVIQNLKEIWAKYTESKITKFVLYKIIDDATELINESQKLNFMRWDVLNTRVLLNPTTRGSFEAEVEYLKYFCDKRFDILDNIVKNASFETINAKVEKKNSNNHRHHHLENEDEDEDGNNKKINFAHINQFLIEKDL